MKLKLKRVCVSMNMSDRENVNVLSFAHVTRLVVSAWQSLGRGGGGVRIH